MVPDMSKEKRELPHWTSLSCSIQVLMTSVMIYLFYKWMDETNSSEQKWFYFSVTNALTILSVICSIVFSKESFIRSTVSAASIVLFTFLLPLTLTAIGLTPGHGLLVGMVFIMMVICVSPIHIACFAFAGGVAFVWLFPNLSGVDVESVFKPALAYLAMTGVTIIWRALLMKLMLGYIHLTSQDPGKEIRINNKVRTLEEERDKLRTEIITHVVELNEAVLSHQPEKQEGLSE
jgi:hypothetical protein